MKDRYKAFMFVGLTQIIWPTNSAVPVILLDKFTNIQLLFLNSLAGVMVLLPILTFRAKLKTVIHLITKPEFILKMVFLSLTGIFLYLSLLYQAYQILPAQLAYSVNLLWPVMTVIFSIPILQERIDNRQIIGIFVSFFGVLLIISAGNFSSFKTADWDGVFFAFLGATCYGIYSVYGKKWNFDREASIFVFYLLSLFLTLSALLQTSQINQFPTISHLDLVGIIWVGGFVLALGDLFWFLALKYGNTAELSSIVLIGPFIALFWIHFLLHEPIEIASFVGLIIVVIGIYLSQRQGGQKLEKVGLEDHLINNNTKEK